MGATGQAPALWRVGQIVTHVSMQRWRVAQVRVTPYGELHSYLLMMCGRVPVPLVIYPQHVADFAPQDQMGV